MAVLPIVLNHSNLCAIRISTTPNVRGGNRGQECPRYCLLRNAAENLGELPCAHPRDSDCVRRAPAFDACADGRAAAIFRRGKSFFRTECAGETVHGFESHFARYLRQSHRGANHQLARLSQACAAYVRARGTSEMTVKQVPEMAYGQLAHSRQFTKRERFGGVAHNVISRPFQERNVHQGFSGQPFATAKDFGNDFEHQAGHAKAGKRLSPAGLGTDVTDQLPNRPVGVAVDAAGQRSVQRMFNALRASMACFASGRTMSAKAIAPFNFPSIRINTTVLP